MEIYRSYSPEELDGEITMLKSQATLYTTQTQGEKSYTKALDIIQNRLQAAIRVRNERSNRYSNPSSAVPDFSNGIGNSY
jgi:hypothetical protein